jgi:hypothetical protein
MFHNYKKHKKEIIFFFVYKHLAQMITFYGMTIPDLFYNTKPIGVTEEATIVKGNSSPSFYRGG